MPDETGRDSSGLSAPAKRGRPRKYPEAAGRGNADGDPKPEGREPQPERGAESVAGINVVDPFTLPDSDAGADTGSDQPRKRRGRKARAAEEKEAVQNITSLLKIERLLVTGCFFLGNLASAPELHISDAEAAEISEALKELAKFYPIGMSEKAIAWVNLSFAVGGVFGPRVIAITKRPRVSNLRRDAVNGSGSPLAHPMPSIPLATPATAKVPSEMWPEPGGSHDDEE